MENWKGNGFLMIPTGNKKSIGEYEKRSKNGKWFFWNDATLSEVDYSNSQITEVKNWKQCDACK
jgi:hypothetical protein